MTELTYTKNGDYLIPDLTLSETPEDASSSAFPRDSPAADIYIFPVVFAVIIKSNIWAITAASPVQGPAITAI